MSLSAWAGLAGAVLLAAFLVWFVAWGLLSKRHRLPCPSWLGWMVEMDNPFTRTNRAAFIVEALDLTPGMRVLDAGCGPGRLTIPLAEAVGPHGVVTAVDIQPAMLERVRARLKGRADLTVHLVAGALEEAVPADAAFDRALLVTVLGEIPDQAAALRRVHDSLRPGGVLSITELVFDPHFQRLSRITARAEAAGFRPSTIHGGRLAYTAHFVRPAAA
ncbi:class I SAM-dependent methyltransferase [Roseospira navarrensis]|uniref:Methyltransferase domain-containing protein n=1 Tax=Roseospira navarrensis TaxID=140058 RepID=A0A7X1ZFE8_9PROT|nr:class I SAM-dependent methyltransferase [Roseospira navarrensis]MQX37511.1 methyltransferase domain-containing protein [Roseospira navarrensis]